MLKNIIYGTAKFCDLSYGYGSRNHENFSRANLLYFLQKKKIQTLETSNRYVNSINLLKKNCKKIKLHYKIDNIPLKKKDVRKYINNNLFSVMKKLNLGCIDVLYVHQNNLSVISNKEIQKTLENLRVQGIIKNAGVSIYFDEEMNYVLKNDLYKYIQFPINIADTYLYNKYKSKLIKKKIVARSLYLQGTLLNNLDKHPRKNEIINYKEKLFKICNKYNLEYFNLITSFVFSLEYIDYFLIGSIKEENINRTISVSKNKLDQKIIDEVLRLSNLRKNWSNPKNW